jgi:hypothetical protein
VTEDVLREKALPIPFHDRCIGSLRRVACGHLFGNVPIKEGVERYIIGTGMFRTFIQLQELSLYLLPDCLLSLVDRPVKG